MMEELFAGIMTSKGAMLDLLIPEKGEKQSDTSESFFPDVPYPEHLAANYWKNYP